MVARGRPINWNYLIGPTSEGLRTEAQASTNLSRSILAGAAGLGRGIARGRQEKEDKRRYGIESARRDRAMGLSESAEARHRARFFLDYEEHLEDQRDSQALHSEIADALGQTSEALVADPQNEGLKFSLRELTDMAGGPQAAQQRLSLRSSGST